MLLWYVAMYLYVSRAGFYNGKPWKIIKVEKAAGGEMICFLSHQAQFLKRAKFYNGAGIHGTGARECCMLVSRDLSEND